MDQETKDKIKELFGGITEPVRIIYFASEKNCPYCRDQRFLLEEVVRLSNKLQLVVYDFDKDRELAKRYRVDKVPATIIVGKREYGIRFFGYCASHEFTSLINALVLVGGGETDLNPELVKMVQAIKTPVHLEVMVTLACPYCPQSVYAAHQLAFVNENITADMVEASEFPELSKTYDVSGVPKTMINGRVGFTGALPAQSVYLEIVKTIDPEGFERAEQTLRETQGHRHVVKADENTVYDTIIIGGGPAALSAAVYAARKEMNVLLVARELGGQMTSTAVIDNYLGLPGISGRELKEQFVFHAEQYPIAEHLGEKVSGLKSDNAVFHVLTDGNHRFKARSIIYAAGKEYRRLGVPGEDKFIGRGVAFCATCDAPLYRGKRVAVVGGGNSAFTALRDLAGFAKELFLIHRRNDFRADDSLVREIKALPQVRLYPDTTVREYLGGDKLQAVRLLTSDGKREFELEVDAVFLEIGLMPNTDPAKGLIELNSRGEIPVEKDNSTSIPGFFAAGDSTDVADKQIIIAAGEGAKAAIGAYNYLIAHKLFEKKVPDESWSQSVEEKGGDA
jgi:alkyl hydroperoxide reductase subunit F